MTTAVRTPTDGTESVTAAVSHEPDGPTRITIAGRLDCSTLPKAWTEAVDPVRRDPPSHLSVDVSAMTYCDGAGLGLFAELRRLVAGRGGTLRFEGARTDQQRLLQMAELKDPLARQLQPTPRPDLITQTGKSAWALLQDLRQCTAFTGELLLTLAWAVAHPRKVRVGDLLRTAEKAGANAVSVVSLLGLLVGLILAFQTATPLERFGAQPMIPMIVSIAVVREMGPLITAIILAGRSGSAFAAEIGTMQVTEELSALKTLGLDPARFLIAPRVLAALLVMPLLTVFNILMSLLGGYIVMASLGYTLRFYLNSVSSSVNYLDFIGGVAKSVVFGLIVAAVGCLRGMQTKSGPGAVGDSTTRAVVAGIVLTIAADAVLGVVYYYLGI